MKPIIEVKDLEVTFKTQEGNLKIVDHVSFSVNKGETLGIVGESGCGKSVTSLSLMGLLPPIAKVTNGSIKLKDKELVGLKKRQYRSIRGKEIAMIFQEPMTSLNPVYTIGQQLMELIRNHNSISKKDARKHAIKMLDLVGIPRSDELIDEYPHQLSGGMRQRVMIAMAMSCDPEVLVADEPTTALDVTIQAQILELMAGLQKKIGMSMILITHDLGVVAEVCDRVVVMYAGQVVEECSIEKLFSNPSHPYTQGLLSSVPNLDEEKKKLSSIPGTVPSPNEMPKGCRFAERCSYVHEKCYMKNPDLFITGANSRSRCWLNETEEEAVI
ncbi:ABC transporter ATP-binding protein [Alkalihalophilus marmarensis]|uniref:ABC transporter ATP-binding protein n=1 Tax=Alkalihalophilus marmarensis TaxID=521377 RepID=UPI0020410728|nr:ABC transporter ATP-binding protein [Alkalihalophilus marmarensis]MCM3489820.1 ABC transporter ATP-binding protein [Alkalihalophilus marmarensis]